MRGKASRDCQSNRMTAPPFACGERSPSPSKLGEDLRYPTGFLARNACANVPSSR